MFIKKWQEPLYGIGGMGTSFMYQVAMSYLITLYVPTLSDLSRGMVLLVPPVLFSILFMAARFFDGVIDLPIASWTDNMRHKWGRRRPMLLAGILPMILTYILVWSPPVAESSAINLVWVVVFSMLYFFFYTFTTVPYLAALSEIVPDERARVRTASWQTFFHTIGYVLAYVAVPILFGKFGMQNTVYMLAPVMLTMLVPLFVIKEKSTKEDAPGTERIPLGRSFALTLKNKQFQRYLAVLVCFFFGLQLFLSGIKYMANDMMGLSDTNLGLMNAAAFAPIPVMLLLFNRICKKYSVRAGLRAALICFAVSMLLFTLGWTKMALPVPPFAIGVIAGVVGSFSIGAFFTIPYAVPAQIAAEEAAQTGKNRCGMYFAVQGLINQIIGSVAGSVIVINLAQARLGGGQETSDTGAVFIGPIVAAVCVVAFVLAGRMPGKKQTEQN